MSIVEIEFYIKMNNARPTHCHNVSTKSHNFQLQWLLSAM